MAQSKKMNEAAFAKLVKELNSVGEFILTKQNEKQSVMDDFEKERARFKSGKISEASLVSSSKKVNLELERLDKGIREAILKVGKISSDSKEFAGKQKPKVFRSSVSGLKLLGGSKKKASPKRKSSVKDFHKEEGIKPSNTILEKEKVLDRKFVKKK